MIQCPRPVFPDAPQIFAKVQLPTSLIREVYYIYIILTILKINIYIYINKTFESAGGPSYSGRAREEESAGNIALFSASGSQGL